MIDITTTTPVVTFSGVNTIVINRQPSSPFTFGTGTDFNTSLRLDVLDDGLGNPLVTMSGFVSESLWNFGNFLHNNVHADITNYVDDAFFTLRDEMLTVSGSLQNQIDQLHSELVALSGTCCSGTVSGTGQMVSVEIEKTAEAFLHATEVDIGIGMDGAWSILAWVRSTDNSSSLTSMLVDIGHSAFNSANAIELHRGSSASSFHVVTFDVNGATHKVRNFDSFFPLNTWIQIIVTWNGTDLLIYKNGSLVSPDSQVNFTRTLGSSDRRMSLGGNRYADMNTPGSLEGSYYTFAMWNVALAAAEIIDVYNYGDGPSLELSSDFGSYVSSSNLLHWWRLGFDSNDIGKDYGNHTALIDVMADAVGIDSSDIVNDYPGM